MPRRLLIIAAFVLSGALAGCGDDDPEPSISQENAQILLDQLDEVEANVDVGSCLVASDRAGQLLAGVEQLQEADPELRRNLEASIERLQALLESGDDPACERQAPTETQPTETQPTETQPTETQTETQPTETQPTETQPTETQPTETQPTTPTTPSGGIGPAGGTSP